MTPPPVTDRASAIALVRTAIEVVAPDIDAATLPMDADMRVEAELDSMDFMAVLAEIQERGGIAIPDSDVAKVTTLEGCAAYLVEHVVGSSGAGP